MTGIMRASAPSFLKDTEMSTPEPTWQAWYSPKPLPTPDGPLCLAWDGPLARVLINRPEVRNAMSEAMWDLLLGHVQAIAAAPQIQAVVVEGAGTQAFCAGADMAEFAQVYATPERTRAYNAKVQQAQIALERLAKPTLALVRGACVGGGCGIALACDMRVVAHDARLGITPSKIGAAYSLSDTRRLVALVGPARAKDMLFSGRLLGSEEALRVGLVDRCCDSAQLAETARQCVDPWLGNSGQSIAHAKRSILSIEGIAPMTDAALQAGFDDCFAGPDFAEGYAAFLAKRAPKFQ